MARDLWAKIYVNLRHHPKLIGRPDADKWLWVCLILHAKEHCPDFIVRDLSAADMRGAFGIRASVKAVAEALEYFTSKGMLVRADGGFLIHDMKDRQAKHGDTPEAHAERQRQYKLRAVSDVTHNHTMTSTVTSSVTSSQASAGDADVDVDVDLEKDQKKELKVLAQSAEKQPPVPPSVFVLYVSGQWRDLTDPADFEARAREAFPGIDPLAEARKARGWELADARHRKRKHGPFLWNWLTTAQERASKNGTGNGRSQLAAPNLFVDNDAHHAEPSGRKIL